MLICAAGDIHGAITRFCDDVLAFGLPLGAIFDWFCTLTTSESAG